MNSWLLANVGVQQLHTSSEGMCMLMVYGNDGQWLRCTLSANPLQINANNFLGLSLSTAHMLHVAQVGTIVTFPANTTPS